VKSRRTRDFHKLFVRLPRDVQEKAKNTYRLFKVNPYYPGIHFECIDRQEAIYSVRIGLRYRAVGLLEDDVILWFFIGSHEDYNNLFL
jgi:hypothetical protein